MTMMDETYAWLVVGVAALGVLAGLLALTRRWPSGWRALAAVLVMLWLLLPWPIQVVDGYLAPAFIVAIFEGLFNPEGDPWPASRALIFATVAVLAVAGLFRLLAVRRKA
jgi:hypothetical protein